ncbi:MAG: flippase-like domain-containing protein [Hamadaea sp.]|uniref:lysylphosphatidylglycerol synthase transmembrane domain-containing protein n=1 Tax=Hamadaea sp. TaxID=2024425 RepID=UPI0018360AD8|nr:lysylphosphatidylglycerol synthase transmembrane domain-containing protein [Hamadaea sp.]NUT20599.1 flippase-like domain-containing protein [Hamadaea sp.]
MAPPSRAEEPPPSRTEKVRSSRKEKIVWLVGALAMIVVFVWVVPRVASYAEIWRTLQGLSGGELVLLLGLGLVVLALNGWSAVAALPGLSWWHGTQTGLVGNFLTALFPTGADLAARYAMCRSWGFSTDRTTTAVALAGIGRYLTMLLLPVVGTSAVLITGRGDEHTPLFFALGLTALVLLVGVPWVLLRREDYAHRFAHRLQSVAAALARRLNKPPPRDIVTRVLRTREHLVVGVRQNAPLVVATQIAATGASYAVLLASLRAVGLGRDVLTPSEVLYAYALGTIASLVPLTPGNLGVTELILIGVLGLQSDELNAQLVAASLIFRIFVWLLPIPLGMTAFFWWRHTQSATAKA